VVVAPAVFVDTRQTGAHVPNTRIVFGKSGEADAVADVCLEMLFDLIHDPAGFVALRNPGENGPALGVLENFPVGVLVGTDAIAIGAKSALIPRPVPCDCIDSLFKVIVKARGLS